MKNINKVVSITAALLSPLFAFAGSGGLVNAGTVSLTASVQGEIDPVNKDYFAGPGSITNGGFLISDLMDKNRVIGDGDNEITSWAFDFRKIPGGSTTEIRELLKTNKKLCSAIITLEMTPGTTNGTKGDAIGIVGLKPLGKGLPFRSQWLEGNTNTSVIKFDLLNYHTPDQINNNLKSFPIGQIHMLYYDDALISEASLVLNYSNTNTCPSSLPIIIDDIKKRPKDNLGVCELNPHLPGCLGLEIKENSCDLNPSTCPVCDPRFCDPLEFVPGDQFLPGDEFNAGNSYL